jgi:GT2 family glycosyltransferase
MQRPLVSVIIPHLNQPQFLCRCLAALNRQTLNRSQFEVIVVDNGSISLPATEVASFKGARLIQETKAGPGPARNRGVSESAGKILAFTDADCVPDPNWLTVAIRELDTAPRKTILGGDIRILRKHDAQYTAIEAYESIFGFQQKKYIQVAGFAVTANLILQREDFDKAGPFAGIDFAEDMDFGTRARSAGCAFRYVPAMIVFHPARSSLRDLCIKWDRHLNHFVNKAQAQQPWWRIPWTARAFLVFCSPAVHVFKILTTDRVMGLRDRAKAFAILLVVRSYRAWRMITLLKTKRRFVWNSTANMDVAQERDRQA